jgi:hypothetical protein
MKFLAALLLILSILPISARPLNVHFDSSKTFYGPDRSITWRPWHQNANDEQYRASVKPIKLSMIRLRIEKVREKVVIPQGLRYAIVQVTNDMMTEHQHANQATLVDL